MSECDPTRTTGQCAALGHDEVLREEFTMDVFVTGATGYIGGAVAVRLLEAGHKVSGLARSPEKAAELARFGITPILGSLEDAAVLAREARRANAVINAADSDHRGAVEVLIEALAGSGKILLHTSGSSIVADDARGEPSDAVYDELSLPEPTPDKAARVAIDRMVQAASGHGIRSAVICNTLIYGHGRGPHRESIQLPALASQVRKSGIARHVGRGLNIWSNVHIDDVAELYLLALGTAPAGSFLFAENGEASFRDMVGAISQRLGTGVPQPWSVEDAVEQWGFERAVYACPARSIRHVNTLQSGRSKRLKPAPRHA
jgi:nucleoside-diphosphate-sugar epimerase